MVRGLTIQCRMREASRRLQRCVHAMGLGLCDNIHNLPTVEVGEQGDSYTAGGHQVPSSLATNAEAVLMNNSRRSRPLQNQKPIRPTWSTPRGEGRVLQDGRVGSVRGMDEE